MAIEAGDLSSENPLSLNPGGTRFHTVNNAPLQNLGFPNNVKVLDALAGLDPPERGPGRPPIPFDEERAEKFLACLEDGYTLQAARAEANLSAKQVKSWSIRNPQFGNQVLIARAAGAHSYADRVAVISKKVEDGELAPDAGRVAMAGCQWLASKFAPRHYGERLDLYHQVKTNSPDLSALPLEALQEMEKLLQKYNLGPDFKPITQPPAIEGEFTVWKDKNTPPVAT